MILNTKLKFTLLGLSSFCLSYLFVQNISALEVDREVLPRITVGGQTIATANGYNYSKSLTSNTRENISTDDSALLLRFDKHMYGIESGVAGAVIGLREISNNEIFHQLNAFYWNKSIAFRIGKTKLRNTIIEFPTLRDEDLIDYTHVNTTSSDADMDQLFGSSVSFDYYLDQANNAVGFLLGTRNNDSNNLTAPEGYDTKVLSYLYKPSENLKYLNRIRNAGIVLDAQRVQAALGDQWMQSTIIGVEFNLNINPASSWSMALQTISVEGIYGIVDLSTVSSRARAHSNSQVVSLRYTSRPKLLTRWQFGLLFASKKYNDVLNAQNTSIISNFSYLIGQGVHLITQIKKTDYSNAVNSGNDETVIQAGISFQFNTVFNNSIGKRNSILNMEHGYIQ